VFVAALFTGGLTPVLFAQSSPPPASQSSSDNPFPGDATQAPAGQSTPQKQGPQKPGQTKPDSPAPAPAQRPQSDNPFPGEDTNAPIIPVEPGPGADSGAGSAAPRPDRDSGRDAMPSAPRDADPDGDPVRSPDSPARQSSNDGFSSSRSGLNQVPADDMSDEKPAKSGKTKTGEQVVQEDLDVGGFYMERKNWKAAQARFGAAFALDSENPEVVWGLAEAERHLQLYKEAAEHYKLFLSYQPDGRRGREARKALAEVQAAQPSASSQTSTPASSPNSAPATMPPQ